MLVNIPDDIGNALYEALLKPRNDIAGTPGYFIAVNDAFALRMAIGKARDGRTNQEG